MAQARLDPTQKTANAPQRTGSNVGRGGPWPLWARAGAFAAVTLVFAGLIWQFGGVALAWALETQRALQTELARGVRAVRNGEPMALLALLGACFFYGVAHAVGPGHGKLVMGGAAAASRRTAWRMAGVGLAASLIQGLSAIGLAYGALGLFSLTGRGAVGVAEGFLAPLSAALVALVGVWIIWRGVRTLRRARPVATPHAHAHAHAHGHAQGEAHDDHGQDQHSHDHHSHDHHDHAHDHGDCGCRHGPSASEMEQAEGWREVAALTLSIGARPCSGALIVLAIAWNFQLYWAGALSALAMAVGTGLVVASVALVAALYRDAHQLRGDDTTSVRLFGWVQIGSGALVAALSGGVLAATLLV
ncbi:MAG: hypothetical protein AAF909_00620 [Pseudomonadota bacterium]